MESISGNNERSPNNFQGVLAALAGAALWGFSGTCLQFLGEHYEMSPLFVATVRMLGAGALFAAVLMTSRRDSLRALLADRRDLASLTVFGIIGLMFCQVTYIITINYTNAGTATVLQSLNIVMILGITCLMTHRLPRGLEIAGVICAFAATVLVATKGDLGSLSIPIEGLIWGIISAATVIIYVIYPQRLLKRWGSMLVTGCGMLIGGAFATVTWLATALIDNAATGAAIVPDIDATAILLLAVTAILGTFAAFGLYLHGVSIVGATRGSQLGAIEPVTATIISALWLGTLFTWADWLGLVLIVITIVIVSADSSASSMP